MNHFVPVFGIDEDHSIPSSSGLHRHDDEVSELLWRNGQLVVQSQNQRLQRKSPPPPLPEDDSMPWLHFPIEDPPPFDPDLADLFSFPPPPPPIHHRREAILSDSVPIASSGNHEVRDSAVKSVVSESPAVRLKPNFPAEVADRGNLFRDSLIGAEGSGIRRNSTVGLSREADTYDLTLTSSLGGSVSASDRKRKGREHDAASTECQSEDVWIESYEPKKQSHGANTKRSRAAEVHNRSERRRRDRINEKMKVLQALIPSSSKTDKSSMLDEAIEYLKSLQMQVQMMMSMGCGMVPMMFPGIQQQYMGMRMAQQMMSFPGVLPGSAMQTSGAPSHLDPRFPFQPFPMPSIPVGTGPSSIQQASNQGEFNMAGIPSPFDPYQQCPGIQQTPMQIPRANQTRFTNQVQTEEAKTKTL